MSWRERIKSVFIDKAEDWTFDELTPSQIPDGKPAKTIEKDKAYVTLRLRSMRVINVRKVFKKFYGAVHSFVTIGHLGVAKAEFQVFTTPKDLQGISSKNLDKVLCFNIDLLNSIPYRGDGLKIELGLYSIQDENLADSFLKVLEGMSNAAGVSFVSNAIPFVKPLSDGIDFLMGTTDDRILEIGLSTKVSDPKTGTFVIMRAPKNTVKLHELHLDKAYRLVDEHENPLGDYPYLLYSIESSTERENWYQIPELLKAFNSVNDAIREGNVAKVDEAFMAFKRIVSTSPDIIEDDGDKMIERLEAKIEKCKKTTLRKVRAEGKERRIADLGTFKDLDIYGA